MHFVCQFSVLYKTSVPFLFHNLSVLATWEQLVPKRKDLSLITLEEPI